MHSRPLFRTIALGFLLAACETSSQPNGVSVPAVLDVQDPAAAAAEQAQLVGGYMNAASLSVGDLADLTLRADGTFERDVCEQSPCSTTIFEAGTYSLSESVETQVWSLLFSTSQSAGGSDSYTYQRIGDTLSLQLVGASVGFVLAQIDDNDAPADASVVASESARLAATYSFVGEQVEVGDFLTLTLGAAGTFSRSQCAAAPCSSAASSSGSFTISQNQSTSSYYLDFSTTAGPLDRYAYDLQGGSLRLRQANTARWFTMGP